MRVLWAVVIASLRTMSITRPNLHIHITADQTSAYNTLMPGVSYAELHYIMCPDCKVCAEHRADIEGPN